MIYYIMDTYFILTSMITDGIHDQFVAHIVILDIHYDMMVIILTPSISSQTTAAGTGVGRR